tara:strand:+ start:194 stop:400 length:207 start_codon:yes stop_codon:yes gene_type:complete
MKNKLKIYIIHYSKLNELKEYMNQVLDNLNIDFEFAYQFYKENMNIYCSKKSIFIQGSKDGTYKSTIR